jgi:hypothetical protein
VVFEQRSEVAVCLPVMREFLAHEPAHRVCKLVLDLLLALHNLNEVLAGVVSMGGPGR